MTVMLVGMPVVFLLLFVYVFRRHAAAPGLGGSAHTAAAGRAAYANYVAPAIIPDDGDGHGSGHRVSRSAMDMTEGIIDRFRTMHIARVSVAEPGTSWAA